MKNRLMSVIKEGLKLFEDEKEKHEENKSKFMQDGQIKYLIKMVCC